jgi:hypothetical protein
MTGERAVGISEKCQIFPEPMTNDLGRPTEVVPEFIADVGTKKGEKVDYGA